MSVREKIRGGMAKIKSIREREDGGGITETAGCAKCDDMMPLIDEVHHSDGSVCRVMARNYAALEREGLEPLGRYSPGRDKYL
jgi:hypothetical protein